MTLNNFKTKLINKNFISLLLVIAALLIMVAVIINNNPTSQAESSEEPNSTNVIKVLPPKPTINAAHGVVWDKVTDTILFSKEGDNPYPIASITKVLTAIAALEFIPDDTIIEITFQDLATDGASGLINGERWNRDELIKYMLVVSSNDASTALGRYISSATNLNIADALDKKAKEIGLVNSRWRNPSGLDTVDGSIASNYASANDVILLLDYLVDNYPEIALASGDRSDSFSSNIKSHRATSTNELANVLPHTIGAKTGFTLVAGGNLTVVADVGLARPVYIVVLGSTSEARFSDIQRLYDFATDIIQGK